MYLVMEVVFVVTLHVSNGVQDLRSFSHRDCCQPKVSCYSRSKHSVWRKDGALQKHNTELMRGFRLTSTSDMWLLTHCKHYSHVPY